MIKNSLSNLDNIISRTIKNLPNEKSVCRLNETNKTISTVKTHIIGKTNNIKKNHFTIPTIKNLNPKKIK